MPRPRNDNGDLGGLGETGLAVEERKKTRRPRRWKVLIYNDDYTSMDFVVYVLVKHFRKAPAEATHVMLQVHHKGVGVAGVYSRDVAETKVAEVSAEAREHEMPLRLEARPAEDEEEPS
jgi:ATP-dependent Clp protease adaptor protein ClpS